MLNATAKLLHARKEPRVIRWVGVVAKWGEGYSVGRAGLGFAISLLVWMGLYYRAVLHLVELAARNDLYSHVFLIPVITAYLAWARRHEISSVPAEKSPKSAVGVLIAGALPVAVAWMMSRRGVLLAPQDRLFYSTLSFVTLVLASALFFFGRRLIWSVAFPISLLFFLAPLPKAAELGIESFFQETSAATAAVLFEASGAPVFRQGLKLHLPGIVLEVARECSGIRSSLVLFITSLIAGYLFLRNPWKRAVLALLVIPLGIVRNGFRIFTIGTLCIHMGPGMINSWIHRKGGPVFFVLSLVPFFGVLLLLLKTESKDELGATARSASLERS